ncbi:MAG TPA: TIGR00297 family protein [Archaeoglobaceae archaeon]|nr:TIGR00297 family protein [Archaeoglobaceae archaeon]
MLLLVIPALVAPLIPERIVLSILLITLISFSALRRIRLAVTDVDDETSFFNTLLFTSIMYFTTFFGVPESIVIAAMFIVTAHEIRGGSLRNILVFTVFGFFYFFYYSYVTSEIISFDTLFFLSLTGGLTAALIESIDVRSDKRATMAIAVATVYLVFHIYSFNVQTIDLAIAFTVAFLLSLAAMKSGIADESGLMSATLVGTLVIVFNDIRFFLILISFYLVGSISTKYRYSIKFERGVAEPAGGARGYSNVFGNSLAPLFFAMSYGAYKEPFFLVSFVASVAAALGDTMASEIGKTSENVYLITNLEKVEPGMSGGISVKGELAALTGSFIVVLLSFSLQMINLQYALVALVSGFIAVHVDSILGATAEEKGYLTNSGVNFFGTLSSGLFCYLFLM